MTLTNHRIAIFSLVLVVYSTMAFPAFAQSANQPATQNSEAAVFVKNMGIGWNLGNTLDACGDWIDKSSIRNFETAWGSLPVTKSVFEGIKAAGFSSVRIPVAWSNMMTSDYTINSELMNRVEEIVGFALASDLIVVLNIHWDGGWFARFSTDFDQSIQKYLSIWTQISTRFKNASDHLIFESLNEEGCFNDVWDRYNKYDYDNKAKAFAILNTINQNFVNLVRKSGGNNDRRFLLVAGYATDIDLTIDEEYIVPEDPVKHCIVSVHFYSPPTFAILEKDASWGKAAKTWGTDWEINDMKHAFDKLKPRFLDQGIPVIVGEYGVGTKGKDKNSVVKYLTEVSNYIYSLGMCPMLWDIPDLHFSRTRMAFKDGRLAEMYKTLSQKPR